MSLQTEMSRLQSSPLTRILIVCPLITPIHNLITVDPRTESIPVSNQYGRQETAVVCHHITSRSATKYGTRPCISRTTAVPVLHAIVQLHFIAVRRRLFRARHGPEKHAAVQSRFVQSGRHLQRKIAVLVRTFQKSRPPGGMHKSILYRKLHLLPGTTCQPDRSVPFSRLRKRSGRTHTLRYAARP